MSQSPRSSIEGEGGVGEGEVETVANDDSADTADEAAEAAAEYSGVECYVLA